MATTNLKIISRVNDGVYSEFFTPSYLIAAARLVVGEFDVDPAANVPMHNPIARINYGTSEDGLTKRWYGKVWLNPPYGKHIWKWVHTLIQEYTEGRTTEAILLVPGKIETAWYQALTYPRCEHRGRVKFDTPYGKTEITQQLFGSVLFYFGPNVVRFVEVFEQFGNMVIPWLQGY